MSVEIMRKSGYLKTEANSLICSCSLQDVSRQLIKLPLLNFLDSMEITLYSKEQ
jgi:hypothetical protein